MYIGVEVNFNKPADYSPGNTTGLKKIAPPRKPVTFFYDGKKWQRVTAKSAKR